MIKSFVNSKSWLIDTLERSSSMCLSSAHTSFISLQMERGKTLSILKELDQRAQALLQKKRLKPKTQFRTMKEAIEGC